eukprot:Skav205100  [mRNA]  locus=scaffold2214:185004:194922:+ [translate_table: standard]
MDLFLPTGTVALPMAAAVPRCTGAEPRPVQWGSKKALLARATDGPEDPIDLDIAGLIDSLQGFVHRRYGYRGVVLSCEPWCTANRAWKRMMGVSNLPRGEWQPFYHCLVDERDRPGGQVTFVGEENLTPDDDAAFPVQHPFIEPFLIRCDELKSYLPSPKLEEALSAQRDGDDFRLHPDSRLG